jgi:hypothetical protein
MFKRAVTDRSGSKILIKYKLDMSISVHFRVSCNMTYAFGGENENQP